MLHLSTKLIALCVSCFLLQAQSQSLTGHLESIRLNQKVRVCIWPDYYGITFRNPKTQLLEGVDAEMALELGKDLGVGVEFVDSNFAQLINDLTVHKCDVAMFAVGVTAQRADKLRFTRPTMVSDIYAITTRTNRLIKTWADIDKPGVVVAVMKGTLHEPVMRERLKLATLKVVDTPMAREQEVSSGRADVFMTDYPYSRRMLETTDWARLISPIDTYHETKYAYAVAFGDEKWAERVDEFVRQIQRDGRLLRAATRYKLDADIDIAANTPIWIQSDPLRLSQILNNLLGNALKFTQHGTLVLRVCEAPQQMLRFDVEDSGVGISPAQLNLLFQPFSQADTSTTRIYGGTGLGLAICKQLCDRMNGRIQVQSAVGQGSVFSVFLPFEPAIEPLKSAPSSVPQNLQSDVVDFAGLRVLLVEDHALNRQLLVALLTKVHVDVTLASDGQEALHILEGSDKLFDLVLMDIQMPVMDGITATRLIRLNSRFKSLPVIAVTANAMADERAVCLTSGMQDYLVKPLDRLTLYACIDKWRGFGR